MQKNSRIYVAGHNGMVGSAIVRRLRLCGYTDIVTRTRRQLDLRDWGKVSSFFAKTQPEYVFLAAAKVGGIGSNLTYPGDFIRTNLEIQTNVIDCCECYATEKLLFLGSSCIYPRECPQPIKEEYLMTGPLETTNEAYAVAKIAGIKMCEAYARQYSLKSVCLMPCNLYGPGDNFDQETGHVIPSLIARFHHAKMERAKSVKVWGTGRALREFMHVDSLADAAVWCMESTRATGLLNVGTGNEIRIRDLVQLIAGVVGYDGEIVFDATKPDGTPRKVLDCSKLANLGWRPTPRTDGLGATYEWYLEHAAKGKA